VSNTADHIDDIETVTLRLPREVAKVIVATEPGKLEEYMRSMAETLAGNSDEQEALRKQVEQRFAERMATQYPELKPHMVKYKRFEFEYIAGAMSALGAVRPNPSGRGLGPLVPVRWVVNMMIDRPILPEERGT
jgi:hypothetical protein